MVALESSPVDVNHGNTGAVASGLKIAYLACRRVGHSTPKALGVRARARTGWRLARASMGDRREVPCGAGEAQHFAPERMILFRTNL